MAGTNPAVVAVFARALTTFSHCRIMAEISGGRKKLYMHTSSRRRQHEFVNAWDFLTACGERGSFLYILGQYPIQYDMKLY